MAKIESVQDQVLFIVDMKLREAESALTKFTKKFAENPSYALEWGDSAFQAAAMKSFYTRLKSGIMNPNFDGNFVRILNHLRDEVLISASQPSRSSSPTTNLMAETTLMVKSDFVRDLQQIVKG